MKNSIWKVGLILCVLIGVLGFFISVYVCDTPEPDFSLYQNKIDSLQGVIKNLDSDYKEVQEKKNQLTFYYDSLFRAAKGQYDSLFNSMHVLTIDEHVRLLSDELSEEDSISW